MTYTLLFFYSLVCSGALLLMYAAVRFSHVSLTRYGRRAIIIAVLTAAIAAALPILIGWHSRPELQVGPLTAVTDANGNVDFNNTMPVENGAGVSFCKIACIIYYVGLFVALIRFLLTISRIFRLAIKAERHDDVLVSDLEGLASCSWGPWIIMSQRDFETNSDIIITHEMAHRTAFHWIDLLFLNLLGCLTWYCPAIPLMRRLLQSVHEFEADRAVLEAGFDARDYQMLLISKASGRRFANSVTDSINNHPLKQRIIMMQKKSPLRHGLLRALALLPVSIVVLATASTSLLANQAEAFMPAKTVMADDENSKTQEKVTDSQTVNDEAAKKSDNNADEKVFTEVEVMPIYPGGDMEMFNFINKNLRYPEECAERDIQGRVIVQFEVKKDGSIGKTKVVRGVDPQLDGEAIRIVRSFPKFTPGTMDGTPVNVWYTLPFNFKIGK